MAFSSKKSSFNRLILLVFGIAFGLVALAFAYQGVKTSSDIRSRAAATNQIYKQWEFNGSDAEGWKGDAPYTSSVKYGSFVLTGTKASSLMAFRNTSVSTTIPAGLKSISFSMAVGQVRFPTPTKRTCPGIPKCSGPVRQLMIATADGCPVYQCSDVKTDTTTSTSTGGVRQTAPVNAVQGVTDESDEAAFKASVNNKVACTMEARICPDGTAVGRSGASCSFSACPGKGQRKFVGHLYYKLSGSSKYERPIQFMGNTDGAFQTITINLPNSGSIAIDSIRIVLTSGIKGGDTVGVDWIRLLGPIVKPTPTPTCTQMPPCAYTDAGKPTCKLSAYAPSGGNWCPRPTPRPSTPTPVPTRPQPTIIENPFGRAMLFDGKTGYISIDNSTGIQPKLGFTAEAWFKPTLFPNSGRLISKMSGTENSFSVYVLSEQDPANVNNIRFYYEFGVANGGKNCAFYTVANEYITSKEKASQWQHIAGVVQDSGKLDLFINGQRSQFSSGSITGTCDSKLPILIGARQQQVGTLDGFIGGAVDEVRLSSVSRYPENFTPPAAPFVHDANDSVLYHLDGSTTDSSGGGHTGVTGGTTTYISH